ncbi:hypothetical protein WR25_18290 [Diploscapter pachys]|uniref:Uncharacterized protein n=1 Tax=Diploscapter pachys TaxID=2018661 RepID=A0A2A2LE40_9BILA|nr:hypothetical protein WR25_18290 [Diploscapter pachys]
MLQYVICGVLISEILRLSALPDPTNNPVKCTAPPLAIASKTQMKSAESGNRAASGVDSSQPPTVSM